MKTLLKALFAATVLGTLVAGCGGGGGGGSSAGDTVAPTVLFTAPAHNASAIGTNSSLTVTFSEAIDPATVTNATIVLTTGGVPVNLTSLSYDATNRIVTMTPAALTGGQIYTAQVTTNVRDLAGNRVATPYIWSFTTAAGPDVTLPTVTSTSPLDGATGVGTNASIAMTFSEPMDAASVETAFSLNPPALGTLTYFGKTAVFRPTALLNDSTTYTATLAASAKDLANKLMGTAKTWSFTTGSGTDTTAPTVTSTSPLDGATGVGTNTSIAMTFSEPMNFPSVYSAFSMTPPVDGTISYFGKAAVFTPTTALDSSRTYTVTLAPSVADLAGNTMGATKTWTFTTGSGPDTGSPSVTSVSPIDGATGVSRTTDISVTFNKAVNPDILGRIDDKDADVTVNYITNTVTMRPTSPLDPLTVYPFVIQVRDLSGNLMAAPYPWSFTTGN